MVLWKSAPKHHFLVWLKKKKHLRTHQVSPEGGQRQNADLDWSCHL